MGGEFGIPGGSNSECSGVAVARRSAAVEEAAVGLHHGEPGVLAAESQGAMAGM